MLDTVIALVIGAVIVATAFVGYQNVFIRAKGQTELAALKSVVREAQVLLVISGSDRWDTQAGLDAVLGAIEDWPVATIAGIYASLASDVVEADIWPSAGQVSFVRSPHTLLVVSSTNDGWCVTVAPPTGAIDGGCVTTEIVGELTPTAAVAENLIAGLVPELLGDLEPSESTNPQTPPPDKTGWAMIATGDLHSCGLDTTGVVWCWGLNNLGQLGINSTTNQLNPQPVDTELRFTTLAAGSRHSCGIDTSGDAWCWGQNQYGQLGNNTKIDSLVPTRVTGNHTFTSLTTSSSTVCGLDNMNKAWCWGRNQNGQLGNNSSVDQSEPVAVFGNRSFKQIVTNGSTSCGLANNAQVWCWGRGVQGELGNGTTTPNQLTPVAVSSPRSYVFLSDLCALDTNGAAWCWGLVDGAVRTTPVAKHPGYSFSALAGNRCGISNSTVLCWGTNSNGQLGNGSEANTITPTPIVGDLEVVQLATSTNHTCAVDTNGKGWCWGANSYGQLGVGDQTNRNIPVELQVLGDS